MKLINVGSENSVNIKRIVGITSPSSSPIKRSISNAKDMGMLVDMTGGKRIGAVIIMESGHIILSHNKPETLKKRVNEE